MGCWNLLFGPFIIKTGFWGGGGLSYFPCNLIRCWCSDLRPLLHLYQIDIFGFFYALYIYFKKFFSTFEFSAFMLNLHFFLNGSFGGIKIAYWWEENTCTWYIYQWNINEKKVHGERDGKDRWIYYTQLYIDLIN